MISRASFPSTPRRDADPRLADGALVGTMTRSPYEEVIRTAALVRYAIAKITAIRKAPPATTIPSRMTPSLGHPCLRDLERRAAYLAANISSMSAGDVLQEVLTKIFEGDDPLGIQEQINGSLPLTDHQRSYIRKAMRHLVIDAKRKKSATPDTEIERFADGSPSNQPDAVVAMSDEAESRWVSRVRDVRRFSEAVCSLLDEQQGKRSQVDSAALFMIREWLAALVLRWELRVLIRPAAGSATALDLTKGTIEATDQRVQWNRSDGDRTMKSGCAGRLGDHRRTLSREFQSSPFEELTNDDLARFLSKDLGFVLQRQTLDQWISRAKKKIEELLECHPDTWSGGPGVPSAKTIIAWVLSESRDRSRGDAA